MRAPGLSDTESGAIVFYKLRTGKYGLGVLAVAVRFLLIARPPHNGNSVVSQFEKSVPRAPNVAGSNVD